MNPEVMTAEQVAEYLQINKQTVYRRARAGEIPSIRIGKVLRFKKEVIDGWLRLSSLGWDATKREELRKWGEEFAREKGLTKEKVLTTIKKRRQKK